MTKSFIKSSRGQLIYFSAALITLLFLIALYSTHVVTQASSNNIIKNQHRQSIQHNLNGYTSELQQLESTIFLYVILLQKPHADKINKSLENLTEKTLDFSSLDAVKLNKDIGIYSRQLIDFTSDLKKHIHDLTEVLSDPNKNFPATPIITESLLPLNNVFIANTNIGIESSQQIPSINLRAKTLRTWNDIRHLWSQQIGYVRLYFTNRTGIFGDPEKTMLTNLKNRSLYIEDIEEKIKSLINLDATHDLGLEQSDAIQNINNTFISYENILDKVTYILEGDRWRNDIQLIENEIRPILEDIWHVIQNINSRLDSLAADEFYNILSNSNLVSKTMALYTLFVIIIIALGYRFFEVKIRRPILDIAQAMDSESEGQSFTPKLSNTTEETKIAYNAFIRMQKNINYRQVRLQSILDNVSDSIITLDKDGYVESFNQSSEILFGYRLSEIRGKEICILFDHIEDNNLRKLDTKFLLSLVDNEQTLQAKKKDGSLFPVLFKLNRAKVQGEILYTLVTSDVSQTRSMIQRLRSLAEHDQLTGLFNRFYFMRELEDCLSKQDSHRDLGFIYINLNHFKIINDALGHHVGDHVLKQTAEILCKLVNESDLLARLGADEFGILIRDTRKEYCISLAEHIKDRIPKIDHKELGMMDSEIDISCSIGIVLNRDKLSSGTELFAKGDIACQLAKAEREKIHVYQELDQKALESMSVDMSMAKQIKNALQNDLFTLAFQPIVDLKTEEVCSYEILIRMLDNDNNIVNPTDFLPVAERYGLMLDIDKWVINRAALNIEEVHKNDENVHFSINLSTQSIVDPLTFESILRTIQKHHIVPESLTFEVTETVAIENIDLANALLKKLQDLGCKTSLDDFGTGYSSFAYLRDLAVDYVKIDGSFVQDICSNRVNHTMVKSLNDVAHAMKKITVAEYVKDRKTQEALIEIGIDLGQGFQFGKPEIINFSLKDDFLSSKFA